MKKQTKFTLSALILGAFLFIGVSSGEDSGDEKNDSDKPAQVQIGGTYSLDSYHKIEFKSSTRYWIYQKPLNCGGEGNWSQSNGKITLGPNDSNCESTRKMEGEDSVEQIVN